MPSNNKLTYIPLTLSVALSCTTLVLGKQNFDKSIKIEQLQEKTFDLQSKLERTENHHPIHDTCLASEEEHTLPHQSIGSTGEENTHTSENKELNENIAYREESINTWRIIDKLYDQPLTELEENIKTSYKNESKDYTWSISSEDDIHASFAKNGYLSTISVDSVECKSSQCKFSFFITKDEKEKLIDSIHTSLTQSGYYSNESALVSIDNPNTGGVDIFLVNTSALTKSI